MRLIFLVAAAAVLSLPRPSFAQPPSPQASASLAVTERGGGEWIEYVTREDGFTVNFPREPTVRGIMYATEYGITLPGRVHSYEDGSNRYAVTVVDYSNVQTIHAARLVNCDKYPNLCANPWVGELRGAMDYAAGAFLRRNAKVTDYAYSQTERIEGRRMQLLNPDGSQTFVMLHMHQNRLYILEGTVAAGSPPPALFQQSLSFVDKDGFRVRYDTPYSNAYPPPPRVQYPGMPSAGK
jgi:hypothetical protein